MGGGDPVEGTVESTGGVELDASRIIGCCCCTGSFGNSKGVELLVVPATCASDSCCG